MCTVIGLQGRGEDIHKKISLDYFKQEILFKGGDGFGSIIITQDSTEFEDFKTDTVDSLINNLKEKISLESKACFTVLIFSRSKPETEDKLPNINYGQPYTIKGEHTNVAYVHHGLISSPDEKGKFKYTDSELFKDDFKNGVVSLLGLGGNNQKFFDKYKDSSMAIIGIEKIDGYTPNLFSINNYLGVWFKWESSLLILSNSRPNNNGWLPLDDYKIFRNQFTKLYFSFPYDVTHEEKKLLHGFVEGISIDDVLNEPTNVLEEIVGTR